MLIDADKVQEVFKDCLFRPEEITAEEVPEGAVIVEGVMCRMGLHPGRLKEHAAQIERWLLFLPVQFRQSGGGGWSFLNACEQIDGQQWTGLHQRMDELFMLGMAVNLVACALPRELWGILPGAMPYYVIKK